MRTMLDVFHCISDRFKIQEMCKKAVDVKVYPSFLWLVPHNFKTQEMCDKAVKEGSSSLQFVPNWFVTREWMWMWYDDYYDDDGDYWDNDNEDKLLEW